MWRADKDNKGSSERRRVGWLIGKQIDGDCNDAKLPSMRKVE